LPIPQLEPNSQTKDRVSWKGHVLLLTQCWLLQKVTENVIMTSEQSQKTCATMLWKICLYQIGNRWQIQNF